MVFSKGGNNMDKLSDDEIRRLIIALANIVIIENNNHDIKFKKEKSES